MARYDDKAEDVTKSDVWKEPKPEGEAADAEAAKKPLELVAEARGMLPQMREGPGGLRLNPDYWKFAAAKALMGWSAGQLVTDEEFDRAVEEQAKQVSR